MSLQLNTKEPDQSMCSSRGLTKTRTCLIHVLVPGTEQPYDVSEIVLPTKHFKEQDALNRILHCRLGLEN